MEKRPEDLSVEELRRLLLDKRRVTRKDRLERFRRTGRAISLTVDTPTPTQDGDEYSPGRVVETPDEEATSAPRNPRRVFMDRLLLGIEVLAIIGLIGIGLSFFGAMRAINEEVAASIQQPMPEPTALITAVVLPSGHTPPTSEGGAQPNDAEIPEHLRPLVQTIANIPVPTPGPGQAIRIQIPSIGVDAPIVQGDGWEQLKKGVGQHIGTPNPGQNGNLVLSAHNDIFGEIFRELDKLQPGDVVIVYNNQRQFTYIITGTQIVEPTRVEVMAPTPNSTITLISCYPYMINTQRIVVSAALQNP
jgi:sortase A